MAEDKKKKGKAKGKIAAGTGLALLTIALGLNWGLGGGLGDGENDSPAAQRSDSPGQTMSPAPSVSGPSQEEQQERLVEVSEDSIFVEGVAVAEEDLQDSLLRLHEQGDVWELKNRHGKKHAYDVAKATLQGLSIPFFESEE